MLNNTEVKERNSTICRYACFDVQRLVVPTRLGTWYVRIYTHERALTKCKAHFPCGCLSTLAPLHSAHVWMRRCFRVVPHALGESTLMCINTKCIMYLDVYQAVLTRRRACLQIVPLRSFTLVLLSTLRSCYIYIYIEQLVFELF
jgi:hypothetical protein